MNLEVNGFDPSKNSLKPKQTSDPFPRQLHFTLETPPPLLR